MMDEEKAKKFLNAEDAGALDTISHTHDRSLVVLTDPRTNAVNAETRHRHRGKLLGIVDRLLATTAIYANNWERVVAERNDVTKSRDAYYESYKREVDDHSETRRQRDKLNNQLTQYQSLGDLKPWFGGPYAALTLKPEAYDRVFGVHEGVKWVYGALSKHASHLQSEVHRLAALADRPMQILDDAQGYYTVSSPVEGENRLTVKALSNRVGNYRRCIAEYEEALTRNRMESDQHINTINRKDAKLIEQQKRIDELEALNNAMKDKLARGGEGFVGGIIFAGGYKGFTVELEGGGHINLAELVRDAGKLRSTQEDYGDVMVALMDAEERVEELRDRLGHIGAVACGDADVPVVGVDHGSSEGDQGVYFIDIEIPGAWGFMHKPGKKD